MATAAAALPVDPATAKPITKPTHIVLVQDGESESYYETHNTHSSDVLTLPLDADEQHLFDSLRQVAQAFYRSRSRSVVVRVAGGWVRDKVLGLPTHDVDIALDTCTGVEFATFLKEYLTNKQQKQETEQPETSDNQQQQQQQRKIGKIGVIAANPAQSKHLETATMRLYGMDVDFCNLRSEAYADEDSRIPTSSAMGTPLEDSYRRDFTMNALYYNLHSNMVEDWTNQGLLDLLDTQLVRTPLEAYQTFHDDPLRVLRAIRFAVRYEMALSEELQQAAVHPQIHNELHRKVSRERVGKELEGMLSGKHANPIQALKLICNLKLAGSVFCFPSSSSSNIVGTIGQTQLEPVPYRATTTTTNDDGDKEEDELGHLRQVAWEEARECLRVLPKVIESVKLQDGGGSTTTMTMTSWDKRMLYLGVVLLPYKDLQYVGNNNKVKYVAESMMREGIKFKNTDVAAMITIVEQLNCMFHLLQRTPDATSTTRLQAGLLLRATKNLWVTTLMVATVALLRKSKQTTTATDTATVNWNQRAQEWYHTIVVDLELDECWKVKPLMNGKDIIQLLGLCKGPLVGIYTQEQMQWMLMHPQGTVEDCKTFLKSCYKQRELESDQAAQHISKKMHL